MELFIIVLVGTILFIIGIREKKRHDENVEKIPLRINVNGIRGKSTATRLITAILKEVGYKVIGKTTGTSARMIYWYTEEEKPIIRRPEGPNINEQKYVMEEVSKEKANAIVCECMAVNPDYQITFQEELLKANIGVIVNVLEDHMDVMGPTLNEVADAFLATIPYNGYLVTIDSEFLPLFKKEAKRRNTKVIVAPVERVREDYLRRFDYMIFPDNIAIGLAVAKILNIKESIALKGMLKAQPDPGAMRIYEYAASNHNKAFFVNAFAANEPTSSLVIWERIQAMGLSSEKPLIIMNCRSDRIDRTKQFAHSFFPHLNIGTLILIGEITAPIVEEIEKGKITCEKVLNLEYENAEKVIEAVDQHVNNQVIFCVGNIHGLGEQVVEHFTKTKLNLQKWGT